MSNERRAELHSGLTKDLRQLISNAILNNQNIADSLGLQLSDMQCLGVLELMGSVTPGKLAESTALSTGGVTVMLDRLQKAGYIKRVPNPTDRRSVLIQVNPKQIAKLNPFYSGITARLEALYSTMTLEELEIAKTFLSRLTAARPQPPKTTRKRRARTSPVSAVRPR
jgi:MarR family transcriptional regulator, organic hydroperoxide resistance regulator